jgi:hypothetical protein
MHARQMYNRLQVVCIVRDPFRHGKEMYQVWVHAFQQIAFFPPHSFLPAPARPVQGCAEARLKACATCKATRCGVPDVAPLEQ